MRRVLKVFAALIGLAVLAFVALIVFLPTERIVALAGDQVRAATGRDLTATGAISPSFYPILGVEIGEVALSNAPWGEAPSMVTAGSVKVGVELAALIGGEIKVSEVRLVDPVVALEIGADGVGNWVFDTAAPAAPADPAAGGLPEGLSFGEITVANAALSFRDHRDGTVIEANALNAEISLTALDAPLGVVGDAIWNGDQAVLTLALDNPAAAMAGEEITIDLKLEAPKAMVAFDGRVTPPAEGALPRATGRFDVTSTDPGAAALWAAGLEMPELAGLSDIALTGEFDLGDTLKAQADGGVTRSGERLSIRLGADGGAGWMETRAFTLDVAAELGALAAIGFVGDVAAPAGAAPQISGAYEISAAEPASAAAWATGGPAPAELAGLSNVVAAGELNLTDALRLTAKGGALRDGAQANIDLSVDAGPGWETARAAKIVFAAVVDGVAEARFDGDVAAPEGAAPRVKGAYSLSAPDPARAIAWATGAPAPAALAGVSALYADGRVNLTDALAATVKGGATRDGVKATIDLKADAGPGWMQSRAFNVALAAAAEGLADLTYAGGVALAPDGSPRLDGQISLNAPDLKRIAALAGAPLPAGDPKAFRRLALKGSVKAPGPGEVRLQLSSFTFDDIKGAGAVAASYGGPLQLNADLTTGPLNLNPYVTDGAGGGAGQAEPGWSKEPLDLSALKSINGDFKIRAESVTAKQLQLGKTDIAARLSGGKLDLDINELGLYGGGAKGKITVDGANGNAVAANVSAGSIRLLPMLQSLAGLSLVEGVGRTKINVRGQGASLHAIMNSLSGNGDMMLTDGAIVGYNLAAMVRNVTNAFTGGGGEQKTDFSEISGTFNINGGVLGNVDFRFLGPLIRVTGSGDIDLGGQSIAFRLVPKAVASLKGQGGDLGDKGLAFPLLISGPWSNLSILPDLQGGIDALLQDPEGAIDALKGVVEGVSQGGVGGAAEEVLKAATGAAGGAAGAKALIDAAKGGDGAATGAKALIDAATGGEKSGAAEGAKALIDAATGGDAKKPKFSKADRQKIKKARAALDEAKAGGDKKAIKRARQRLKKVRAAAEANAAKASKNDPVGTLLKGLVKQ